MNILRLLVLAFLLSSAFASDALPPPELQGIMVVDRTQRFALVAPSGEHSGWLPLGTTFAGWKLADYRPRENAVVLLSGTESVTVSLRASVVSPGAATTAEKVTVAEAEAMLANMKFDAMWDRVAAEQKRAMVGAMRQQAAAEFKQQGLSAAEIDGLLDQMGDAIVGGMQSDAMRKDFAQIYAAVYTKDELRGMADFYDTAAGRAWVEKQPDVQQKLMQVLMPRVMQGMPAAQKIAADYLRQRATAGPTPASAVK